MPVTPSPLRYPGGKTALYRMVARIIQDNELKRCHYVEPYAGGAGLALSLLFNSYVHEIHLNDIDLSLYALWDTILNNTEQLCHLIEKTAISIENWHKAKAIQKNKRNATWIELAFSTLFLNRTNRSGIIEGGVIGGLEQSGTYKLDCRFNKVKLIQKIRRIAKYSHRIHFYNLDAIAFLQKMRQALPETSFYCIDPPYYAKGALLYRNAYAPKDHKTLAKFLFTLKSPWVLTYDNAPSIQTLYPQHSQYNFHLNYSAARKKVATELLIKSNQLYLNNSLALYPVKTH